MGWKANYINADTERMHCVEGINNFVREISKFHVKVERYDFHKGVGSRTNFGYVHFLEKVVYSCF